MRLCRAGRLWHIARSTSSREGRRGMRAGWKSVVALAAVAAGVYICSLNEPAPGSTFILMSESDLARRSVAAVTGSVTAIEAAADRRRRHQHLRAHRPGPTWSSAPCPRARWSCASPAAPARAQRMGLRQRRVSRRRRGAGLPVADADGTLRTTGMSMGKFTIEPRRRRHDQRGAPGSARAPRCGICSAASWSTHPARRATTSRRSSTRCAPRRRTSRSRPRLPPRPDGAVRARAAPRGREHQRIVRLSQQPVALVRARRRRADTVRDRCHRRRRHRRRRPRAPRSTTRSRRGPTCRRLDSRWWTAALLPQPRHVRGLRRRQPHRVQRSVQRDHRPVGLRRRAGRSAGSAPRPRRRP